MCRGLKVDGGLGLMGFGAFGVIRAAAKNFFKLKMSKRKRMTEVIG